MPENPTPTFLNDHALHNQGALAFDYLSREQAAGLAQEWSAAIGSDRADGVTTLDTAKMPLTQALLPHVNSLLARMGGQAVRPGLEMRPPSDISLLHVGAESLEPQHLAKSPQTLGLTALVACQPYYLECRRSEFRISCGMLTVVSEQDALRSTIAPLQSRPKSYALPTMVLQVT